MRGTHLFLKVLVCAVSLLGWLATQPLWAQQGGAANSAATAPAAAEPQAASQTVASPPQVVPALPVPRLIEFSGTLKDASGQPRTGTVGLTFSIYKDQEGGATLWMETHNVELDAQGHYSVLLGSLQSEGMPLELFATGDPRWLGVKVELPGEVEQARVLLVSVPYALKASDADTLGGVPASSYVTRSSNGAVGQAIGSGVTSVMAGTGLTANPNPITSTGTMAIDPTVVPQLGASSNSFSGSITASSFAGNGVNLTNVNAAMLGGALPGAFAPASGSANYVSKAGDTMTGPLNLPANGLAVGGTEFVLANGNIGVGLTPPSNQLFVLAVPPTDPIALNMTNLTDQDMLINVTPPGATDKVGEIGPTTATNLGLQVGGVEKVRITNNGNVWIGSKPSSPAADTQRLVIAVPSTDTIAMNMSNLVDQDLVVSVSPPGAAQKMGIIGPTTPTALGLQVGGATKALITNAGMVGIGTMTPGQMLTVAGTIQSTTGGFMFPDGTVQSSAGGALSSSSNTFTGSITAASFTGTGAGFSGSGAGLTNVNATLLGGNMASAFAPASGSPSYVAKAGDTMSGALNLPANGLVVGSTQLVVAGGNVGIGVAAPTQALAVAGTIQSTSGGVMFPDGSTQASSTTPTVLSNDTAVSNTVPQAGNFLFAAPTSAYVAGPNQTALIWSHASCEVPSGDGLGVRPAYNVNSSGDQTIGLWHYHTNTGAATANIENAQFQMLSLTQGSSYVFETGLTNSDTSTSYSATCYVHTFVLIM